MNSLIELDERLFLYLNNLGSEKWDGMWLVITDQWMSIPIYALVALLILRKKWFKPAFIDGFFIVGTVIFATGISHAFKYNVERLRPCNVFDTIEQMRYPLEAIGKECGTFGFVSSHATVAMALMVFVGLTLRPFYKHILWLLMSWVALFCYSRIYVGKHYPGDLIVGVAIGAIIGWGVYKLRHSQFTKNILIKIGFEE